MTRNDTKNDTSYNTKVIHYKNSIVVKKYLKNIRAGYKLTKEDIKDRSRKSSSARTQAEINHSIQSSLNRTINSVYAYSLANEWEWFYTFTFNPAIIDSYNYDEVCKALKSWLDDTRKRYAPNMKYIIVPELHKKGRYHFHGMFADCNGIPLVYSEKGSSNRTAVYNLPTFTYGFTTATLINDSDRTCSYCLKYITKDLCAATFNKRRYWHSKNISKPREYKYLLSQEEYEEQMQGVYDNVTCAKTIDITKAHNMINLYMADM